MEKSKVESSSPATGAAPGEADVAAKPFSWHQRWLLVCLSAGSLLAGCCTLVQVPFFPHEARQRGLSNAASSAVFSCFALSELLAFPVTGWLAPRLGVTRLYQLGLAIAGLSTVAFGLLTYVREPSAFLSASLVVRVVEAGGTAATQTAARTIVANQFPRRLNTVMGLVETMSGAGLCLGPALGGAVYALGGYGAPFYLLGGMHLVIAAVSVFVMPAVEGLKCDEPEAGEDADSVRPRCGYVRMVSVIVSTPDNWLSFAVLLVAALNWTAMDPSMESYVHSALSLSPAELGLFFLASFAAYALASPVWGRISDAVGNTFLLVAGCLAPTALGVLLIPPAPVLGLPPSRALLALGMVLRETFQVGAYLPLLALLLRCSVAAGLQDDVRGQALVASVYGTVYSVGKVAGPVGGGLVTDRLGYPVLATWLGAATVVMSLTMAGRGLVYKSSQQQRRPRGVASATEGQQAGTSLEAAPALHWQCEGEGTDGGVAI